MIPEHTISYPERLFVCVTLNINLNLKFILNDSPSPNLSLFKAFDDEFKNFTL